MPGVEEESKTGKRIWRVEGLEDGGLVHRVAREGLNDKVTFNSRHGLNLSQTLYSLKVEYFIMISKWS